ncbi:hypothetical protein [Mucilaginibacter paludis]|uniref:Uncharacterized protein n=1 Tax=Mucilaginibacter paludis DSM 18603 TaxID=714943 RepID=H1Y3M3_9SPHI|nr:hypothetical protein [Mucilaginibacter paludis]EHQ29791.1 hypothetical protein Mucpa_5723 [Mucilaginibacter paludis DSM 18603]
MGKIIALKGRAESGKSTTIGMLPSILATNGYTLLAGSRKVYGKDFLEIYTKGKLKLGITSAGDSYDLVHDRLDTLVAAKCDDIICACRTYGGTHAAIATFTTYKILYIPKTYAASAAQQRTVNTIDANAVFAAL